MKDAQVKLSDLTPGRSGIVKEFSVSNGQQLRLMELGILPGTEVTYVRKAPLGDPLEISIRGYNVSLRRQDADCIEVEPSAP